MKKETASVGKKVWFAPKVFDTLLARGKPFQLHRNFCRGTKGTYSFLVSCMQLVCRGKIVYN
jgi:hypothetical protein